ncbi:MAG: hypothetical protein KF768_11140 [Phycisphaeraceae bacterium]|nr:hypothetical protein [Phycisphaeraceae bacterium]
MDQVAPVHRGGHEKKLLLNIRREVQQVHDLSYPRLRDFAYVGEFRLVGHDALAEHSVEVNRKRH